MINVFAEFAFTPSVRAAQLRDGSRAGFAGRLGSDAEPANQRLGDVEADFTNGQRSLYMATVSEAGWP